MAGTYLLSKRNLHLASLTAITEKQLPFFRHSF
jgi:hypothetical protein